MVRSLILALALTALPQAAAAGDCEYTDLQGQFTMTADCEGLQDFNGIGQHQKRLFLRGTWGELTIIEVPQPYKSAAPAEVIDKVGRFWTNFRSPQPPTAVTLGGAEAYSTMERSKRSTSVAWIVQWQGRNLLIQASSFGKKADREARLQRIRAAVEGSFKAK